MKPTPLTDAEIDAISLDIKGFAVLDKEQSEAARMIACACRWDADDNRIATCERHQGWLDVVHEWAERAKAAEKALAAPQPPVVQEPVAYIHRQGNHWEVSERYLEDDEKSRGWTEEPLYTHPAPDHTALLRQALDALIELEYARTDKSESMALAAIGAIMEALK